VAAPPTPALAEPYRIRLVDPDADAVMISEWMNRPHLLPLDEHRAVESRIHLAFAAPAATMPQLARTQRTALADLHQAVTQAFATVWGDRASRTTCSLAAHAAIAAADGLALHAVSSRGWLSRRRQTATIELALDALMAIHGTPKLGPDSVRENQR
jgi:hypothetical protein